MELELPKDASPEFRQLVEQYRADIEATIQPYVEITLHAQPNLSLWQSKLGGEPYFPKGVEYPKGSSGRELQLLAQINFSEVPQLPLFPQTGILQFYTAAENSYGKNYDDLSANDNFRIVYFAEIEADDAALVTDFSFLPEFEWGPLSEPAAMHFEQKLAPIPIRDYRFGSCFRSLLEQVDEEPDDELLWEFEEWVGNGSGHRIGGYPGFTQTDPRYRARYNAYDCLLLQLESNRFIMWGDVGIGNFFIKPEALRKLDFSDVLFNWDCC